MLWQFVGPIRFPLLLYSVLCTDESLSLLYLSFYFLVYMGDDALIS